MELTHGMKDAGAGRYVFCSFMLLEFAGAS